MHSLAHYLTAFALFVLCVKFSSPATYNSQRNASSSNPRKRTKRAMIKQSGSDSDKNETDYLDRWFVGNHESIEEYYKLYSKKIIITPKVLSLEWLKEKKLDEVCDMLKF